MSMWPTSHIVFELPGHCPSSEIRQSMVVSWFAGTNNSLTKHLVFQALFFLWSRALKTLYFCKCIKNCNNFCKEFCKKFWKKNNTWNIGRLIDFLFVPVNQQTSVLYCRLSDFCIMKSFDSHLSHCATVGSTVQCTRTTNITGLYAAMAPPFLFPPFTNSFLY